jgi:hypothetical protein
MFSCAAAAAPPSSLETIVETHPVYMCSTRKCVRVCAMVRSQAAEVPRPKVAPHTLFVVVVVVGRPSFQEERREGDGLDGASRFLHLLAHTSSYCGSPPPLASIGQLDCTTHVPAIAPCVVPMLLLFPPLQSTSAHSWEVRLEPKDCCRELGGLLLWQCVSQLGTSQPPRSSTQDNNTNPRVAATSL